MKMTLIGQEILIEAVKACSKNELLSADQACVSDYIATKFGIDRWDADTLNTELSNLVTDGILDQDENARYLLVQKG